MRSVKLTDPSVQGVLNDLTVIGDFIYLTQASPTPNAMGKPDHSLFKELKETYMTLFTKFGIIRKCKNTRADNQVEEEAECEEEVKEEIGVGNGITTNGFTKLWAVDNQARDIVEFDVDYQTGDLKLNQRIEVGSIIDNLHYDVNTGNIMASTLARGIEFINFTNAVKRGEDTSKVPITSGVIELIFKDGKFQEKQELMLQQTISSGSVAIPWGKGANRRIFVGSWHDPKLAICTGL